jgi:hypothetical protein
MEEVAMAEQHPAAGLLMGFLVVEKTAREDGFIAALMVTDNRGYHLEFRATTPVRPSLVQRTLYGKQLEHYVGVELCGKTLLQQSSRKPKAILVPERQLLDIADEVEVDMVAIWRAGEVLKVEEDEAVAAARGTIKPPGSPSQPLVYEGRFTIQIAKGRQSPTLRTARVASTSWKPSSGCARPYNSCQRKTPATPRQRYGLLRHIAGSPPSFPLRLLSCLKRRCLGRELRLGRCQSRPSNRRSSLATWSSHSQIRWKRQA